MAKNQYPYDGYIFDSQEEIRFYKWCRALQKKGIIESIYVHARTFTLFPPRKYLLTNFLKTKTKIVERELLKKAEYSPDFIISFSSEWRSILFEYHDCEWLKKDPVFIANKEENMPAFAIIDVKGNVNDRYLKYSSKDTFTLKQKIMYDAYNLYVQMIVPEKLFEKTFWPYDILNRKRGKLPKNLDTADQFIDRIIAESNYDAEKLTFI
jgi:hypothetical protein